MKQAKQVKQLIKSKRMAFTSLLNAGWLIFSLSQLQEIKRGVDALTESYPWGETVGLVVVAVSFIGMAWTKLYDDANQ